MESSGVAKGGYQKQETWENEYHLGFYIYMFGGPLFKSVNSLIKEKVTRFVYFNAQRAYPHC